MQNKTGPSTDPCTVPKSELKIDDVTPLLSYFLPRHRGLGEERTFGYVLSEEEQDRIPPLTRKKLAIALIETQSKKNWKRHKNAGP